MGTGSPAAQSASSTALPMPPSGKWSLATTNLYRVASPAASSVFVSMGFQRIHVHDAGADPVAVELVGGSETVVRVTPAPINVT